MDLKVQYLSTELEEDIMSKILPVLLLVSITSLCFVAWYLIISFVGWKPILILFLLMIWYGFFKNPLNLYDRNGWAPRWG